MSRNPDDLRCCDIDCLIDSAKIDEYNEKWNIDVFKIYDIEVPSRVDRANNKERIK
jgi:hypothetical protein